MTQTVLNVACERWALADATIELVAARENHVYRVQTDEKVTALRLHRNGYRTEQEIHAELQWMEMLATHGIPVPEPVNALDGTPVQIIDGTIVDMLTWLEGTPLANVKITRTHYFKLGCLLAKMHRLADQWCTGRTLSRPTWDLLGKQPTWGRFWNNPLLNEHQQLMFESSVTPHKVHLQSLITLTSD